VINKDIENMKPMHRLLVILGFLVGGLQCFSQSVSGELDGHQYVDLGLPSGTLWATCNVGATEPTGSGDYFAWGEVNPKEDYSWTTYKYSEGENYHLVKYCFEKDFGSVDQKKVLEAVDDAVSYQWGVKWRMPSKEELRELIDNCNWKWISDFEGTGKAGQVGTSKINGNKIFFPASGHRNTPIYKFAQMPGFSLPSIAPSNGIEFENEFGGYWSSVLCDKGPMSAYLMNIGESLLEIGECKRCIGCTIRAVVK
jgi:hypothetical protein